MSLTSPQLFCDCLTTRRHSLLSCLRQHIIFGRQMPWIKMLRILILEVKFGLNIVPPLQFLSLLSFIQVESHLPEAAVLPTVCQKHWGVSRGFLKTPRDGIRVRRQAFFTLKLTGQLSVPEQTEENCDVGFVAYRTNGLVY